MTPGEWVIRALRSLRGGDDDDPCLRGRRVPDPHRCARDGCDSVALPELEIEEEATVTCLEEPGARPSSKLASMGILPGVRVRLLQRYPAYVIRLGYTDFALDEALARRIRVRR